MISGPLYGVLGNDIYQKKIIQTGKNTFEHITNLNVAENLLGFTAFVITYTYNYTLI